MVSVHFQGKPFSITAIQSMLQPLMQKKAEMECFYEDIQEFLELTPKKKKSHLQHRGLGSKKKKKKKKKGSQEISGVSRRFGVGVQNESGQRLRVLSREHTSHRKSSSKNTRDNSTQLYSC